jgi:hypothetical protein
MFQRSVARTGPNQLRKLALETVEEAAAASHLGPVPRTRGLALALAWLLHYGKEGETLPRWPFEAFWRELATERLHDRWSGVNAAVNAIYLALGQERDRERQSEFERAAAEGSKPKLKDSNDGRPCRSENSRASHTLTDTRGR